MSDNALKVLYRLRKANYAAYLVGGGVRDLLLGLKPKDFDIVTDAKPEVVRRLFSNCRLIGKRFRLAHIYFRNEIVEVATFRAEVEDVHGHTGMILTDNIYGDLEDDVWRRDFTINALFYNIKDFSIVDYTGGMQDLKNRILRVIGDPEVRFTEDPVRMMRGLRLAVRIGFAVDPATSAPIASLAHLLVNVSGARLFDEIMKWFYSGDSKKVFEALYQYKIFAVLFPMSAKCLTNSKHNRCFKFFIAGFDSTDQRIATQKPVNPAFLFAVLLWHPLQERLNRYISRGDKLFVALNHAIHEVLNAGREIIAIPKKLIGTITEIWLLQYRFANQSARRVNRIFYHPRFRAAYDFLLLRAESGENVHKLADWWTRFQEVDDKERKTMINRLRRKMK
jgi:poly(A) polymerase